MATKTKKKQDATTKQIFAILQQAFPDVSAEIGDVVYRMSFAAIRIRVISTLFEGLDDYKRDDMVMKALKKLPKDVRQDITMILTYTPEEVEDWEYMMKEFDDPEFG